MTGYLDNTVGAYFGPDNSDSYEDLLARLRHQIEVSLTYKQALGREMKSALADSTFGWKALFDRHEVEEFKDEREARGFAQELCNDLFS